GVRHHIDQGDSGQEGHDLAGIDVAAPRHAPRPGLLAPVIHHEPDIGVTGGDPRLRLLRFHPLQHPAPPSALALPPPHTFMTLYDFAMKRENSGCCWADAHCKSGGASLYAKPTIAIEAIGSRRRATQRKTISPRW